MLAATADAVTLATRDDSNRYSHVIIAVAPQHLPLLAAQIPELEAIGRDVACYQYQPIATGYVQYGADFQLDNPLFALADGPAQFVFDRGQSHGQAGLMAFVASAADDLPADWLDLSQKRN